MNKPTKTHYANSKKSVERIKTYSVEFIFDFISKNPLEPYYIDEDGNRCKLRRAKIYFEKGLICAEESCSLKGLFFALERWPNQKDQTFGNYHFDLFAIDEFGCEVLMTLDHVHPKSKGGVDHVSNYQPMCKTHNELKADKI